MRWADYVLAEGEGVKDLWRCDLTRDSPAVFVLGRGFDPRATIGLEAFVDSSANTELTVVTIGLPPRPGDDATLSLAQENGAKLTRLVTDRKPHLVEIDYPEEADRRTAGQAISRQLQAAGIVPKHAHVLVDISGLPSSLAFPIVGGMLAAEESGMFDGDLQVVVTENPQLDGVILEEGASDPGPVAGFNHGLTEASQDIVRIWAPVLGERQSEQLDALFAYLQPSEMTPVLPFPAANPRRSDDLLLELSEMLLGRLGVEPGDFLYAHETNPFDLYRALWSLSEKYGRALKPLGPSIVIASVHGSKTLSIGTLLAAWERKLPVVATTPTDYVIASDADIPRLMEHNRLTCAWILGKPYA